MMQYTGYVMWKLGRSTLQRLFLHTDLNHIEFYPANNIAVRLIAQVLEHCGSIHLEKVQKSDLKDKRPCCSHSTEFLLPSSNPPSLHYTLIYGIQGVLCLWVFIPEPSTLPEILPSFTLWITSRSRPLVQ